MISSKVWLGAAVAAAVFVSSAAVAQTNLKVGVVNIARLIEQSPQYATVSKKLEDEFGPRQRDLTAMQTRLRTSIGDVPERLPCHGGRRARQPRAADPRRAARAATHGERVSRGFELAPQRGARNSCSARCCTQSERIGASAEIRSAARRTRRSFSPARQSTSPKPFLCAFEGARGGLAAGNAAPGSSGV